MAIITNPKNFVDGDGVSAQDMNDMVETCINANTIATQNQDMVEKLVQQPDSSNANNIGTPSVSIGEDGKLYFYNLKGEKGEKGDSGTNGTNGVSVTHRWDGTTLIITSASGTKSADLKGEKGEKGDVGATLSYNSSTKTLTIS